MVLKKSNKMRKTTFSKKNKNKVTRKIKSKKNTKKYQKGGTEIIEPRKRFSVFVFYNYE